MLNTLEICIQALGFLIQSVPIAILCFVPFDDEVLLIPRKKTIACVCASLLLASVFFAGMTAFLYARPNLREGILRLCANGYMGLARLVGIFFFFWNVRAPKGEKFLVILILVHYAAVLFTMTSYLNGLLDEYRGYAWREEAMYGYDACFISFGLMGITVPLLYIFLRGKVRRSIPAMEERTMKRGGAYLAISMLLYCGVVYVLTATEFPSGFQGIPVLYVLGAFLLTDCVIYFMFFTEIELVNRNRRLEEQLRDFDEQYRRISSSIEESRRTRHDIRHHLNMISMFNEQRAYEELTAYLARYEAAYRSQEERIFCGYPAVDGILKYYVRLAEENAIEVNMELSTLKESMSFDVIDMVVLLGNVVENAIESCIRLSVDRKRYIRICMQRKRNLLLILVENSCESDGVEQMEFRDSIPAISTKHAGTGQGMKSVRLVAEKYGGSVEYKKRDGTFWTRIVLNEPE